MQQELSDSFKDMEHYVARRGEARGARVFKLFAKSSCEHPSSSGVIKLGC